MVLTGCSVWGWACFMSGIWAVPNSPLECEKGKRREKVDNPIPFSGLGYLESVRLTTT